MMNSFNESQYNKIDKNNSWNYFEKHIHYPRDTQHHTNQVTENET